ncbi:DUF4870 domain-containing protein [Deinococcus yavapaiensis]|uniref:Tic20 family protein n=1 Tax=Deinococcus yavapaiensis KR-236 TaxID=694435 RepID=A0A318SFY7_9DEIO|nr:DUF4870 domain-containing protein [Deinococcus yavapaiensis]PYE52944.1 hypothetical protein DES52_111116 [Deinococcus yavapaiensis KR-236]
MQPSPLTDHVPLEHRSFAAVEHLAPLLALFLPMFGNVVGALAAWLLLRERHPVLDAQGKESLNFQLSLTLYSLVGAGIVLFTFGLGLLLLWPVFAVFYVMQFVVMILAVASTLNGKPYRYPLSIRFVR